MDNMPLIIITGIPLSGKTQRTGELKKFFEGKYKQVEILSDDEAIKKGGFRKNNYYVDSKLEKAIRGEIRSSVERLLNSKDVLIVDACNYIKGSRYELYCLSKLYKTPQCTIHCDLPVEHAWLLNEEKKKKKDQHDDDDVCYTRNTFDALVLRYETPDAKNRWDSPLFTVTPDDELPLEDIFHSLYSVKAPKPNMGTQSLAVSATNYLYELDRISQEIVNDIITANHIGIQTNIKLAKFNLIVEKSTNASQLTRLRRQFLTFSKMHQTELPKIAQLFVQYLNKSI